MRRSVRGLTVAALSLLVTGCGASPGDNSARAGNEQSLTVSAIPDQDPERLQRQFGAIADYLAETLDVTVRYVPVTDYTASVTGFRRGDLDLVFFGGLTGVQARLQVPGAQPIAQRDIDAEFRTVFIAHSPTGIAPLDAVSDLAALTKYSFTYGSESSTSGRLMPQHFLEEAGVTTTDFSRQPGFSGSHDATIKLVEAGTYQVGALNAAVWDDRLKGGKVDTAKVTEIFRTPTYHDYHWLLRPDGDERFGAGFTERVKEALLSIDGADAREREILELFQCSSFIASEPGNYAQIEAVARSTGLIK